MSRQTKYTRSAKGQSCTIRIPEVCNHDPETTVLAHLNGSGMSMKQLDIHGAYACSDCHDAVDFRVRYDTLRAGAPLYMREEIERFHLDGVIRTQKLMVANGILLL